MHLPTRGALNSTIASVLFIGASALCQTPGRMTISGVVLDDSTLTPLGNVNVFLSETTLGAGTNDSGRFVIGNVPPGSYDLVSSRVGYRPRILHVTLSESGAREFKIQLRPAPLQLGEVVVPSPDPTLWRKQLEEFRRLFFGTTRNAGESTLLNPEVLDFKLDELGNFVATAREPLEIENLALGYRFQFVLIQLRNDSHGTTTNVQGMIGREQSVGSSRRSDVIVIEGGLRFTELKTSDAKERRRWEKNRREAYNGSLRHFLVSLFNGRLYQEGFEVYRVPVYPPREWVVRMPTEEKDLLYDGQRPGEKVLRFEKILEVEYPPGPLERDYNLFAKKDAPGQTSWLWLNLPSVTVNQRGMIKERLATHSAGYWAWKRMADEVPLDYEPEGD